MSDVGYATLPIIPSMRGARRTIESELNGAAGGAGDSAGREFGNRFESSSRGALGRVGGFLTGLAKGAGILALTATAAAAAIGGLGIKGAANLETTTTAFTSLLGSATAATNEIQMLQQYAAKTPFSQQDVLGYAQQYFSLAGSIGLAKDQVIPFLDAVGNLGAVTGASTENIHNAVMAIGQIGSAGKVTLENLNQISEAFPGFNGAAAIASATGQTTAQVLKQISAGSIDAKTGVQALLVGMQKFPGAANAMVQQGQTLKGLFSTFKDTISISLTQAFTPLLPQIKQVLSSLTPAIQSTLNTLIPAIVSFAQNLVPLLQPLLDGLGKALASLLNALGPALSALEPVIAPLTSAFVTLVDALAPIALLVSRIIAQVGPPLLQMFSAIVDAVSPVITALSDALAPVLPIIADALSQLTVALRPVLTALSGTFVTVIKAIAPQLPALAKAFGDLAVSFAKILVPLTPLIPLFAQVATMLTGPVLAAITTLVEWTSKLVGWIADLLEKLDLLAGNDIVVDGVGSLSAALTIAAGAAGALAENIGNAVRAAGTAGGIAGAIGGGVTADTAFKPGKLKTTAAKKPAFDKSTLTSFLQNAGIVANPFDTALAAILASAAAAGKKLSSGIVSIIRAENSRLKGLVADRTRITARLAAAQTALAAVEQRYGNEKVSVQGAFRGAFNLGTSGTGFDGQQPVTASRIFAQIKQTVNRTKRFFSLLQSLKRKGIPPYLLDQLAQAGVAALPEAEALAGSSAAMLKDITSEVTTLNKTSTNIGKFLADDMYGAGVNSAKGLVAGLKSQESALTRAIKSLAQTMVDQLKTTLGIHSPSAVTRALGVYTGQGFALGLDDQHGNVQQSAKALSNKGLPQSQVDAWQSRSGGAGSAQPSIDVEAVIAAILAGLPERIAFEFDKHEVARMVEDSNGLSVRRLAR